MHDVNKKCVSGSKIIDKAHTGLLKFYSMLRLSSRAEKFCFMDYVKVNQEKTFKLRDENIKEAVSQPRDLTIREQN